MKARIITGLVLAAAVICLLTMAPAIWTYAVVQLAVLIVGDEFFRMALPDSHPRDRWAGIAALGALVAVAWWCAPHQLITMALTAPLLLGVVLFSDGDVKEMGPRAGLLLCGYAYLGLPMAMLTGITAIDGKGTLFVLALFAAVFSGDTGAFFSGKFLGNKKLYPKISPKKTWAGAYGGAIASVLGMILVDTVAGLGLGPLHAGLCGLGCGVFGQVGDLAESLFKRSYGVKDSGTLLPGHGGLLDRVDGVLFAAPFMWFYLSYVARVV